MGFFIVCQLFLKRKLSSHYTAEVYPNRRGQICPICVSRVRFSYVNTLKMPQYCGKWLLLQKQAKLKGMCNPCSQKCPNFSREIKVQAMYPIFRGFCITDLLHFCIAFSRAA